MPYNVSLTEWEFLSTVRNVSTKNNTNTVQTAYPSMLVG